MAERQPVCTDSGSGSHELPLASLAVRCGVGAVAVFDDRVDDGGASSPGVLEECVEVVDVREGDLDRDVV